MNQNLRALIAVPCDATALATDQAAIQRGPRHFSDVLPERNRPGHPAAGASHSPRESWIERLERDSWLGFELDDAANDKQGPRISRSGSRVSACVIPTKEGLIIARHTGVLLGPLKSRV
jgi:hypothetical protein